MTLDVDGVVHLLTVPQVMLMSLLLEHGQLASLIAADEHGWLALAYTIFIGGIVGFGLWFWLIGRCSMGRVAPFGLLLPVFALISSVLFLGDRMTPKLIVGGLLAISGVAITQVKPSARPIPNPGPQTAAGEFDLAGLKTGERRIVAGQPKQFTGQFHAGRADRRSERSGLRRTAGRRRSWHPPSHPPSQTALETDVIDRLDGDSRSYFLLARLQAAFRKMPD